MDIIIVGCGKVGVSLAQALSNENHSVSVVDTDEEALSHLAALDVSVFRGNGSSYRTLLDAGVEHCDMLIAVTNRDEVNMLCCLIARKAGNCRTVARVRSPEYYEEIDFLKDEMGLSLSINPELTAANYIYHLTRCPSALELNIFAKGRVYMPSLVIPQGSPWDGQDLNTINNGIANPLLVSIVETKQGVTIPDGRTVLHSGDRIHLLVATEHLNSTLQQIGIRSRPIKNVMIVGGGTIAYYLAKKLIQARIHVTIIEQHRQRCEELSELLPRANIICGNASNEQLLLEEGLESTDAFIALTDFDEENIMLSLFANRVSSAKRITKVNNTNFNSVLSEIPVGSVVSPKHLTADTILHYARALRNSHDSEVDAVHMLVDNRVEALSFRIKGKSAVTGRPLMELRPMMRKGILVASIIRDGTVIIPSGHDEMLPGDLVILVTTQRGIDHIQKILE
ncbi:MAG: Trk system potassium transporter TrkA [Oscillospiraceae bacterium]|nr:Trk system potassium transporter TrkA [Oscillospiraceae bacterium]